MQAAYYRQKTDDKQAGTATWHYRAEDVIDFTWTASPHFVVQESQWKHVKLKLMTYSDHAHFADRYFSTIKNALEYMDKYVGKYPYPSLTIIDPPIHGLFTGGMEYPTLITSLSFCFLPKGIKTPETLAVHEFVHQYFMQMVATHEVEEPWMDEGFTTYFEGRILDHYYGEQTSTIDWMGVKIGNAAFNRAEYLSSENPKIAENDRRSWQYKHGGYGTIAYNKTAMWLRTLEGLVGRKTMDEIMKTYFQRWQFKHPCGKNFVEVVNEIVAKNHPGKFEDNNMNWFFKQVLHGSELCDYKVAEIINDPVNKRAGFFEDEYNCEQEENNTSNPHNVKYNSQVILHRLGELKIPIEVRVNFDDGTSVMEYWKGSERSYEFGYKGNNRIESVIIDPERKNDMDKNLLNNSLSIKHQDKGIRKYWLQFLTNIQQLMQSLALFV